MLWLTLASLALAQDVHPDRVLVRAAGATVLLPGEPLGDGMWVERALDVPGWYVVTVRDRPLDRVAKLAKDLRISAAQPDRRVYLLDGSVGTSWALENDPTLGGSFDADADALDAWAQGARGQGVVVAVIDTGVQLDHPELEAALWTNPGETPGNGVDDDDNGWVDDVHGVDAGSGTGNPDDPDGHGTACAGLVAAADDDRSAVGLAPEAEIMAVRIFEADGSYDSVASQGIVYAARNGARVLSCSWQYGQSESDVVTDAIAEARSAGALLFFAAGNEPLDADENGFWPAKGDDPAIVSVGGSDRHDRIVAMDGLWGSAWGDETVDLLAPSVGLLTTDVGDGYRYFWGTSGAAPLTAATAALIWSVEPGLDADEVKAAILEGTDDVGSETVTGGRLNAGNAVRLAVEGLAPLRFEISGPDPVLGEPVRWTLPISAGTATWYFPDDGTFASGAEVEHTFTAPGPWRVTVEVVDGTGRRGHAAREVDLEIPWAAGPALTVESPHDAGARDGAQEIDVGDVVWTRLHLPRWDLARGGEDDFVAVIDPDGFVVWSAGGDGSDTWTPPLRGGEFTVQWHIADSALTSPWGFQIDEAQVWAPGLAPAAPQRPGVAMGGNGCATSPSGGAWIGVIAMIVRAAARLRSGSRPAGPVGGRFDRARSGVPALRAGGSTNVHRLQ
jgi:subtilisin family serine protease